MDFKKFLALNFSIKIFRKSLLISILKRENKLHLFRSLEKCSIRLIKCQGAIEFIRLCQSFGVTPTFAKVDSTKVNKWAKSSSNFQKEVIEEELQGKLTLSKHLKAETATLIDEIRNEFSLFCFKVIMRILRILQKSQFQFMMQNLSKKLSRLLYKNIDVDEHITNLSSYHLTFFEKLILRRGLKFALPQHISAKDIQCSFEKAFWALDSHLTDPAKKELAAVTLKSIALNYIDRKSHNPPKALVRALNNLKKREDIVISKPDKGSGVVIMDKEQYVRLLSEASINITTKFIPVDLQRPKTRGRQPKHYHPLLEKEKLIREKVHKILPKSIADPLCPNGSRLAHLYGLPKTHKAELCMRPILSASGTYNFPLAKWLDDKLKPLSTNTFCIDNVFDFADQLQTTVIRSTDILVSYDVTSLFTNVPLRETIEILVNKAFKDDWFNRTYKTKLHRNDLKELLEIATTNQLFQFNGKLYHQIEGVAMGSPLGPLLANTFMCHIEEKLQDRNNIPSFYKRYVDDTLVIMPDVQSAKSFLDLLNVIHPSISFTMELEQNNIISFLGMSVKRNGNNIETSVHRKPSDGGLLLHWHSHVDKSYKQGLIKTLLHRAKRLCSSPDTFDAECGRLRIIFSKLQYPSKLVNTTINQFILNKNSNVVEIGRKDTPEAIRIPVPFKNQQSADKMKQQLLDLSSKIGVLVTPIFTSKKIGQVLTVKETKPSFINNHRVVYLFECDLCDTNYVGYTSRHLYQRINEHRNSVIGQHVRTHGLDKLANFDHLFKVLKKCKSKFDCLLYEMLYIRDIKPNLNTQRDSIRAKLFT